MNTVKCRSCGEQITLLPKKDVGFGYYRLDAVAGGPFAIDAKGRLRLSEQTGWAGTHQHHRCSP